jgi:hypothetical protein
MTSSRSSGPQLKITQKCKGQGTLIAPYTFSSPLAALFILRSRSRPTCLSIAMLPREEIVTVTNLLGIFIPNSARLPSLVRFQVNLPCL